MKNRRRVTILIVVALLLFIPFLAMQFTEHVHWTLSDFLIAATLLLATGFATDLTLRKIKVKKYRMSIIIILIIVLLLVWVEIAVGLLESLLTG